MMLQYQTYLFRNLLMATVMITLGLVGIVWLMQALKLVDFIVNQGIPISLFLKLSLLLMPSLVMMVLPAAVAIAVIFFYHRLKVESELVVLQSTGLSRLQLATPALALAMCATLMGYIISLYILPLSTREFRDMQFFLRNNYVSVLLQEGVFSSPVAGLTVYVRERGSDRHFKGILVHDGRNSDAPITMMAENATLMDTPQGPQFLLYQGNRQELRDGKLSYLAFDSYVLDISVYTQSNMVRKEDSDELGVATLFDKTVTDSKNPAAFRKQRSEAHMRILWPALSLTVAAMAVTLTLSGSFNRRQRWQRNAMISINVALLMFAMVAMRGAMANHAWWIPVAYLVLVVPLLLALYYASPQAEPERRRAMNRYVGA